MGNTQARRRLNAKDFQYIASNTALLNMQMVTEYFNDLISKYPVGKMEVQDFKKIFHLAFPERKEAKVDQLAEKLRNIEKTDGTICKLKCDLVTGTTCQLAQLGHPSSSPNWVTQLAHPISSPNWVTQLGHPISSPNWATQLGHPIETLVLVMGGKGGWTNLQDLGGRAGVLMVDLDIRDMLEMQPGDDLPPALPSRLRSSSSITSSSMATLQYGTFLTMAMRSLTCLGSLPTSCLLQVSRVAA